MFKKEEVLRVQLLVYQIDICKRLASNNPKLRRKGISSLKKLLSNDNSRELTIEEYNIIWNGLFNYVWMSDTPLVQESDVESISNLIHAFKSFDSAALFIKGFFISITKQWNRISHYRTDKFLMFMRRFLRQILYLLKNHGWKEQEVKSFSSELYSAIQILPIGLAEHLNDIYNEELAKVSGGNLSSDTLCLLLKCYVDCIVNMKPSMSMVNHINTNIFSSLVRQVKLFIKQKAAAAFDPNMFCRADIEEKNDPQQNVQNFDPRPGNAHVFLPYIHFDENCVVKFLEKYLETTQIHPKPKNVLSQIIEMFRSVTRLRKTIKKPGKLAMEITSKPRKRKKKQETFGSLIKRSCKKLEAETEDFELPLKHLRKFSRLQRKLAKTKTWKVSEGFENFNNLETNVNTSQNWTISDLIEEKKEIKEKISSINWTVSDNLKNLNDKEGSSNITEVVETQQAPDEVNSVEDVREIDTNRSTLTVIERKCGNDSDEDGINFNTNNIVKFDSNRNTYLKVESNESKNEKTNSVENSPTVIDCNVNEIEEISLNENVNLLKVNTNDSMNNEIDTGKNEDEIVYANESICENVGVNFKSEEKQKIDVDSILTPKTREITFVVHKTKDVDFNESMSGNINSEVDKMSDLDSTSTKHEIKLDKIEVNSAEKREEIDVIKNLTSGRAEIDSESYKTKEVDFTERMTENTISENNEMFDSDSIITIADNKANKPKFDDDAQITMMNDAVLLKSTPVKKRVSFCEEPQCHTFLECRPTITVSKNNEIIVPSSVVKERPSLLMHHMQYSVVDFSSCKAQPREESIMEIKTCTNSKTDGVTKPEWKYFNLGTEEIMEVDDSEDESDSDYNLGDLFKSPPKKRGRKSYRQSIGIVGVKRSQRIANKMAAAKRQDNGTQ